MTTVPVPGMKANIKDGPEGLCFNIPAPRQIFALLFLPAWVVGWLFGEVSALRTLASGKGPSLFLLAWLTMWTVGGGFALLTWVWMLAGRERVILKSSSLVHRREIFGIGRSSEYDLAHITNLRVSPQSLNAWSRGANVRNWGLGGGIVAFDYGARTIRFGASIDEAEGSMIVNQLRQRYRFAEPAG